MDGRLRTPKWIGRLVGLVGLVTVASALSPGFRDRVGVVHRLLPVGFPAAATTGAAATGVLLILLSRGLRRGKRRAWVVATVVTAATVALHLVKGLDVEEAVLSAIGLVLLLASRRQLHRALGATLAATPGDLSSCSARSWRRSSGSCG